MLWPAFSYCSPPWVLRKRFVLSVWPIFIFSKGGKVFYLWQYFKLLLNSAFTVIIVVLIYKLRHNIKRYLFNILVFMLFLFNLRGTWKFLRISEYCLGELLENLPGKPEEKIREILDELVGTLFLMSQNKVSLLFKGKKPSVKMGRATSIILRIFGL